MEKITLYIFGSLIGMYEMKRNASRQTTRAEEEVLPSTMYYSPRFPQNGPFSQTFSMWKDIPMNLLPLRGFELGKCIFSIIDSPFH